MSEPDYVIIGAGSAGSVLANRLSADADVVLLEAGGSSRGMLYRMPLAASKLWMNPKSSWGLWTEPEPGLDGRRIPVPRGKALGGSSAINGTVYNRGSPHDLDQWAKFGVDGWDYAHLLPYFRRIESHWRGGDALHGSSGEVAVSPVRTHSPFTAPLLESAKQMGLATSDDQLVDAEGVGLSDFNVDRRGRRVSAADAFLYPIRSRQSLRIETRATVTRILIERGKAVGVEYRQDGKIRQVRVKREVILAGGAIASPQILLLSGVGPAEELQSVGVNVLHDLSGVGRNLNDQPGSSFEFRAKQPYSFARHLRADRFAVVLAQWFLGLGGPAAAPPGIAMGALRTVQGDASPDMRMMLAAGTRDSRVWLPGLTQGGDHILLMNFAVAHPQSRGSVTLGSADPFAPPKIVFNLLTERKDIDRLKSYYHLMRELIAQPAFGDVAGEITRPASEPKGDAALEAYLRTYTATTSHPLGSCRIGSDADAVVDAQCRVPGIENLRVVDASIFPTQISGNPHAVIMAVADRAADLILGKQPLHAV